MIVTGENIRTGRKNCPKEGSIANILIFPHIYLSF
jgi:hypothetical protein